MNNVILIGMPGCGKTTVGSALTKQLGRKLIDTDIMITEATGMTPSEIFGQEGESGFRCLESEAVRKASAETGCIIATGGGAVLRRENVDALRKNGRLYYLDRGLESLIPTPDRPTASSAEAIRKRYEERHGIYESCADSRICFSSPDEAVTQICRAHGLDIG